MITSACFPELPVKPRPSKHLLPSRQSFSKERVRGISPCFCLLPPGQRDLHGSMALTQLLTIGMHLVMQNLAIRNQPKILVCLFLTSKTGTLPCHYSRLHQDETRGSSAFHLVLSTHALFTWPHADCTAKSSSVFLLKILVVFLWGTHTPSGRQMESQSVEKKQTQINNYSLICVL